MKGRCVCAVNKRGETKSRQSNAKRSFFVVARMQSWASHKSISRKNDRHESTTHVHVKRNVCIYQWHVAVKVPDTAIHTYKYP